MDLDALVAAFFVLDLGVVLFPLDAGAPFPAVLQHLAPVLSELTANIDSNR
jgi:hypothetical protein